ncbi:MAG: ATP-binding protein, partial [Desulfovibrionaceae bacterium]|nr:ATP-binding protein [Desulfovibrionaceae bacterium]
MPDIDNQKGAARMRPRARLIKLIGDELISDEPVAVVELVKNAYDADATQVKVVFQKCSFDNFGGNLSSKFTKFETHDAALFDSIVIEDDGCGMSLDDVLNKWLEPGTISKRDKDKTKKGRVLQGAKGIGRFASARLAKQMMLESKMVNHPGVLVIIDWGDFDNDKYLEEVSIEWEETEAKNLSSGTRITLEGLRKPWSHNDFQTLHSRLGRLISPFQDVVDFSIFLGIPGEDQFSGRVLPPDVVMNPRYSLEGSIDENSCFTGTINIEGHGPTQYTRQPVGEKGKPVLCGPFRIEVRAWDRDSESLRPLAQQH